MLTDISSNAPTFASTDPVISLTRVLRDLPLVHKYRYTEEARLRLLEELFASLAGHNHEYIKLFFPNGVPINTGKEAWNLGQAQGAVEGAEYGPAARGKPCGHIFKNGEATYRCKTCSLDETSVLCAKCFESSDHRNHSVFVSISPGNSGCCDCGDSEAWRRDVKCAIHTAYEDHRSPTSASKQPHPLPDALRKSIRDTIAKTLDYICDIISCSPEQLREPKSEEKVREDEQKSRLQAKYYENAEAEMEPPEFSLILWNDEKHTVKEVQEQVGRACKQPKDWCLKRAEETDLIGRSVVDFNTDVQDLLNKSKIIERIKLTMTLRSSRDTFREQMCGTIIEWLVDIAGCAVGDDPDILRRTVCEELLGIWRQGSNAWNIEIGMKGIDDHEYAESQHTLELAQNAMQSPETRLLRQQQEQELRAQREANGEEEEEEEENEEAEESQEQSGGGGGDSMEVDGGEGAPAEAAPPTDTDGDVNMDTAGEPTAGTTQVEPTVPFPPPFAPSIPHTPGKHHKRREAHGKPGSHWLDTTHIPHKTAPYYEDLRQRVRLDWLIMFDLRMWKKARIDLRELYISTVVAIPQFKRILGLRFAGLYTILSQLYLIADREPDHSIINLSLQMLTTPSITAEVVSRGNFLTSLMAILYTFLTTRQVGHPADVNPNATLAFDTGSLTNRRMYHFFQDMKYLFGSESVKELLRTRVAPTLQFLDLVKLHQGICYNNRAIGSHIEYESDAWICASLITREVNKLCRQYADAFRRQNAGDDDHLANAIRLVAKVTTRNAAGMERHRFKNAEIRDEVEFIQKDAPEGEEKVIGALGFAMEAGEDGIVPTYRLIKYSVDTEAMSFHHAMHYLLSWLIEAGNGMDNTKLRNLLTFKTEELNVPDSWKRDLQPEDYLAVLFEYPLRVCVWVSQMKAGMWVRNGFSLRHQVNTYKGVSQRDLTYNRDIFMLQVASVVIEPSKWLLTMINRFTLDLWFRGDFRPPPNIEAIQHLDLAEDLFLLLVSILSDRLLLIPHEEEKDIPTLQLRREITHILCSKSSSFSDLSQRLPDRLQELENFQDVLAEMATYKPPDGLSDSGIYELRGEWKEFIDPYMLLNTKNQREEAELIYKKHVAAKLGMPEKNVVYEPKLKPVNSGTFVGLANITRTAAFTQMIYFGLLYGSIHGKVNPSIPDTRIDSYMHVLLYLVQIAVAEDNTPVDATEGSFVYNALVKKATLSAELESDRPEIDTAAIKREVVEAAPTVALLLYKIKLEGLHESCTPIIDVLLKHMQNKKPLVFAPLLGAEKQTWEKESEEEAKAKREEEEFARKKELAKQRQANIMAQFQAQQQSFMQNNFAGFDMEDDDDLSVDLMDEDAPGDAARPTWEFPTGDCIMCSEQLDDSRAFGTFAMIQETNVLRQTNMKDPDYVYEVLTTPENLDRSAEALRPFGVAGMNRDSVKKLAEDGAEITVTRQGLGKGYPKTPEFTRSGPVAVGCGHLMHYDCFESHIAAVQRRHVHQISRAHPERLAMKEFLCPLCKALGNTFLPIIWKPKVEEPIAEIVKTKSDFSSWLLQEIGPVMLSFEKDKAAAGNDEWSLGKYREQFLEYGTSNLIDGIATKLAQTGASHPPPGTTAAATTAATTTTAAAATATPTTDAEEPATAVPVVVIPVGGAITIEQQLAMLPVQGQPNPEAPPAAQPRATERPSIELESIFSIYKRMRDTLHLNGIKTNRPAPPSLPNPVNDFHSIDALMRILGFTISTTETWLRGAEPRQGLNLIERTPEHNLKYLRILAESVQSYIAFGGLKEESTTALHYKELHQDQMTKLFTGHPQMFSTENVDQKSSPLFLQDIFVFLTECSLCLCPSLNVDFKHIMTLCYIAEIVKAVVVISRDCEAINLDAAREDGERFASVIAQLDYPVHDVDSFRKFVDFVLGFCSYPETQTPILSPSPILFRHLISKYINPFLRKCAYLLHARYMVTFPAYSGLNSDPEHVRLTSLLGLPSLESVFAIPTTVAEDEGASVVGSIIAGWCRHWRTAVEEFKREEGAATPTASTPTPLQQSQDPESLTRLSHPSILELVGLPLHYDTLVEEAMKRRCPQSGRELNDPVVCLLCGDIFCSQSLCCMDANRYGGANQHLKVCGKNIGLFINIRKCHVLYLHSGYGAWAVAPYLDKHGEVDPNLRRNRQLFLHQKRYDAHLRAYWLQHLIPTVIARRLEPDFNTGGWESL